LGPGVGSRQTTAEERTNRLLRVIGPDREGGSLLVHQDAAMYVSRLEAGQNVGHAFAPDFGGYLLVLDGAVTINGEALANGDAAMISDEDRIIVEGAETSELLMMEMQVKVRTE
ncbi:MAG: hypothetical protein IIB18_06730, partial [Chloroflexi bacterium]|nr:hypothetical protein [Chloroflexota bacterium]